MNNQEVNNVIAEFMGNGDLISESGNLQMSPLYTESIDTLIPVWKKLGLALNLSYSPTYKKYTNVCHFWTEDGTMLPIANDGYHTLNEIAALNTAKAILWKKENQ